MKRIFTMIILFIIFLNSGVFTTIALTPPYGTFDFKDTSEWVEWINTADYNEIESHNQPSYSNKMLVEVPRTVGYVLVPKWYETNLSEIYGDGSFPIHTLPAKYNTEDNEIIYLADYHFTGQIDDRTFMLTICPIPSNIDDPMDHIETYSRENGEIHVKIFDHYAVAIYADKSATEDFFSKFSFDKVMLSNADEVVESYDLDVNTLIPLKIKGYTKLSWWVRLFVSIIIILVTFLVVRKIRKKKKLKS